MRHGRLAAVSYTHLDVYKRQEIEQLMKTQPCVSKQMSEETLLNIKTEKYIENKLSKKVALPVIWPVHIKAPTLYESTHWATYLRQFEAAICANHWIEKEKAVSLVLSLKEPATELQQRVPPDSQNSYAK